MKIVRPYMLSLLGSLSFLCPIGALAESPKTNFEPSKEFKSDVEREFTQQLAQLLPKLKSGEIIWGEVSSGQLGLPTVNESGKTKLKWFKPLGSDTNSTILNNLERNWIELFIPKLQKEFTGLTIEESKSILASLCKEFYDAHGNKPIEIVPGTFSETPKYLVTATIPKRDKDDKALNENFAIFSMYYSTEKVKQDEDSKLIPLYADAACTNLKGYARTGDLLLRTQNQTLNLKKRNNRTNKGTPLYQDLAKNSRFLFFGSDSNVLDYCNADEKTMTDLHSLATSEKSMSSEAAKVFDKHNIRAIEPNQELATSDSSFPILYPIIRATDDKTKWQKEGKMSIDKFYEVISVTDKDDTNNTKKESPKPETYFDIYLVMDLTYSMTPFKNNILEAFDKTFIAPIQDSKVAQNFRIGFIGYTDDPVQKGKEYKAFRFEDRKDTQSANTPYYNYTSQGTLPLAEFKQILQNQIHTAGEKVKPGSSEERDLQGESYPEKVFAGLGELRKATWSKGRESNKIAILIGDAPDHADKDSDARCKELREALLEDNIMLITLFIKDQSVVKNAKAQNTGIRQFKQVSDDLGNVCFHQSDIPAKATDDQKKEIFSNYFGDLASLFLSMSGEAGSEFASSDMKAETLHKIIKEKEAKLESHIDKLQATLNEESDTERKNALANKIEAAQAAKYAFGKTMSVWVSRNVKPPQASTARYGMWTSLYDIKSLVQDNEKIELFDPSVFLTLDQMIKLRNSAIAALAASNRSGTQQAGDDSIKEVPARMFYNFLAASIDPDDLIGKNPKDVINKLEDYLAKNPLPYENIFYKKYKAWVERGEEWDLNKEIGILSEKIDHLDGLIGKLQLEVRTKQLDKGIPIADSAKEEDWDASNIGIVIPVNKLP